MVKPDQAVALFLFLGGAVKDHFLIGKQADGVAHLQWFYCLVHFFAEPDFKQFALSISDLQLACAADQLHNPFYFYVYRFGTAETIQ